MKTELHTAQWKQLFLISFCGLFTAFSPLHGQTWTQTSAPTNQEWDALASSAGGSTLLAVGQTAVYTSTNSGATWTPAQVPPPISDNVWQAAAVSANGVTMAAGDYGNIYISTNSGVTWWQSTNAPQNDWSSIACSADGTKMVAAPYSDIATGNVQPLYISTNSGTSWTAALVPSNHWTSVASSADGTRLIALAFNGPIYTSKNSGVSWTSNNLVAYWRSVACSADGTEAIAGADPGNIYTSTNSGVSWFSHYISGAGIGFGSVATSSDGTRLLVVGRGSGGEQSPIFVSTNSGSSWISQANAPSMAFWNAVTCSTDGYKMYAATYGLLVNNNAGGIYKLQSAPSPQLNCRSAGTNVTISWTVPSATFVLQQNADLTTTNWLTLTNVPSLNFTHLQYQIVLSQTNNRAFYRLKVP